MKQVLIFFIELIVVNKAKLKMKVYPYQVDPQLGPQKVPDSWNPIFDKLFCSY